MAKEFIHIPTQKTFLFKAGTKAEEIDKEVNVWMEQMTKAGTPVMLGKTFANHATGESCFVYLYQAKQEKK